MQNTACIEKLIASETHHRDSRIHLLSSHQCHHLKGLLHPWGEALPHCHLIHCHHWNNKNQWLSNPYTSTILVEFVQVSCFAFPALFLNVSYGSKESKPGLAFQKQKYFYMLFQSTMWDGWDSNGEIFYKVLVAYSDRIYSLVYDIIICIMQEYIWQLSTCRKFSI